MFGTRPGQGFLHFPFAGIPVSIDWSFFLVPVMASSLGWQRAAAWTAIVFFSVLAHELGHGLAMRRFGFPPTISLYAFGGLTFWPQGARPVPRQDLIVSAAGPAVSITLGVVALSLRQYELPVFWNSVVEDAFFINFVWGFINLLPLMPLDGSHIVDALAGMAGAVRPRWVGLLSLVCGLGAIGLAMVTKSPFIGLIGGFAMLRGWERLRSRGRAFLEAIHQARELLWSDTPGAAEALLRDLRTKASTDEERALVVNTLAWAFLKTGRASEATALLKELPTGWNADTELLARLRASEDDVAGVIRILRPEIATGQLTFTAAPLLVTALLNEGERDPVEAIALLMLAKARQRTDEWGLVMVSIEARLFEAGDIEHCLRVCLAAFQKFQHGDDAFNAACCFVKKEQPDEAMRWLAEAARVGMAQFREALESDPDLEPLRSRPDFKQLLQ